jgi:calcium channel MID1
MQLSPLQSRLVASVIASFLILVIYLFLSSPHFALAAELNAIPLDHDATIDANRWTLEHTLEETESTETPELRGDTYEPDFGLFDRGIIGRAPPGVTSVVNNVPNNQNIEPGTVVTFVFQMDSLSGRGAAEADGALELRKRSSGSPGEDGATDEDTESEGDIAGDVELVRRSTTATRTLWISANTCMQPDSGSGTKTTMAPPQLTLYVSTSTDYQTPGPMGDPKKQKFFVFDEGAVMYNTTLTGDVFFSVAAPNVSTVFSTTTYNMDIAASVDQSYHTYDDASTPNLIWVDSDANATLMITGNLTDNSNELISTPPYTMFGYTQGDMSVVGIRNSYCGLKLYAQIGGSRSPLPANIMTTGMTRRGTGNVTKQEFYFKGLNSSTTYMGILARDTGAGSNTKRDGVAGGGGLVFRQTEFDTKPSE